MASLKKLSDKDQFPAGIRKKNKNSFQIRYTNASGKRQTETISGDTPEEALAEAIRQLTIRRGDIAKGVPVSSKPHTVTFAELCADVVNNYEVNELSSKDDIEARYRLHLLPFFGNRRAAEIATADFDRYVLHRRKEGAANGTIKREQEAAKRAYLLAKSGSKVHIVPHIAMVKEDNIRKGFFEPYQLDAVCRHLPKHIVPTAHFGYHTGWRHGEVMTLTLGHVDRAAGEIRLEPGETKNGEGRTFPITDELSKLIESVWPEGPVFPTTLLFRDADGGPIQRFDKSWTTACRKAGLPVRWVPKHRGIRLLNEDGTPQRDEKGKILYRRDAKNQLILVPMLYKRGPKKGEPILVCRAAVYFHDFRRTAYRNLVRLGIPPAVARAAVGWLDAKTAERYNIVSKSDLDVLRDKVNQAQIGPKKPNFGPSRTKRRT